MAVNSSLHGMNDTGQIIPEPYQLWPWSFLKNFTITFYSEFENLELKKILFKKSKSEINYCVLEIKYWNRIWKSKFYSQTINQKWKNMS